MTASSRNGLPLQGDSLVCSCSRPPISTVQYGGFSTLQIWEKLLLCSETNFMQKKILPFFCVTVFSFHTGNWYLCMSLNKLVIMLLLAFRDSMERHGSLCVSTLPKCIKSFPETAVRQKKAQICSIIVCQQKTRDIDDLCPLVLFVNFMLLL